jgi:cell shape-determining protein MreD
VLALVALGVLAPMLQGAAGTFVPARFCPDLALLLVVALGLCWRSTSGGLLLAAGLGYATDLLSGALLGQHALLRVLEFLAARLASHHLNLRGPLPQSVFVAGLAAANGLALGALTSFFAAGFGPGWISAGDVWPQALVDALCAPFAVRGVERLLARLGDEDARRLLPLEPRNFSA